MIVLAAALDNTILVGGMLALGGASTQIATPRLGDNGIAISAEALPQIFELFVRGPHARVRDRRG